MRDFKGQMNAVPLSLMELHWEKCNETVLIRGKNYRALRFDRFLAVIVTFKEI